MNLRQKLEILADAAKYDASCASSGSKNAPPKGALGSTDGMGICHSYTPDGRCVSLLKILLTNFCVYDCQYCVNRVSSDTPRARFTPQEVVELTLDFYRRNYIEGLFLSSGVLKNADYTVEQMVEVARQLREDHQFFGYIHLKLVPGADEKLVDKAGRYADRLSTNIETGTDADLKRLAPEKSFAQVAATFEAVKSRVSEAEEERARTPRAPRFAPAGQTTQMLVGTTPTPDRVLLATAHDLYRRHRLRRVYYSAYSPIPSSDRRLPAQPPPLVREHRLYQADWLIRFYGFTPEELTSESAPDLDLELDPKLAWALRARAWFPLDVNRASREELLRVPGLGVRSVESILAARRHRALRLDDLARLGAPLARVRPFVVTLDHRPVRLADRADLLRPARGRKPQLELFDLTPSADRALPAAHAS